MGRIVPVGSVQFTCCERGFTKNRPEDASLVGTLQHSRLICTVCIVVDSCDQATTTAWADLGGGRTDAVADPVAREMPARVYPYFNGRSFRSRSACRRGNTAGIQRAAQTVLGVDLKRTLSRDTSASSALDRPVDRK